MPADAMFQEAIAAIRQGQRARARDLLTRLLRSDGSNPDYWLWLSSVVPTPKEQIYCLQTVLRLQPDNHAARHGLALLGAVEADPDLPPAPLAFRSWQIQPAQPAPPVGLLEKPAVRIAVVVGLAVLVFSLIWAGIFGWNARRRVTALRPTATPGPSPTITLTPTAINATPQPTRAPAKTPTRSGPLSLVEQLAATYTATPLVVDTPHPVSEAYRMAMRAYQRSDWPGALQAFRQASQSEPQAADLWFYQGEVNRFQENYEAALTAYEAAIDLDPQFAPAYVGKARASLALDPKKDVSDVLEQAIRADPASVEAYLERAAYFISRAQYPAARRDLEQAGQLAEGSVQFYILSARLELAMSNPAAALQAARQANVLDATLLEPYALIGQASLAEGDARAAVEALETYLLYAQQDAQAWEQIGQAHAAQGGHRAALKAFNQALEVDPNLNAARLGRGLALLETGSITEALNDLVKARLAEPTSFLANQGLGRGLFLAERYAEASGQLGRALSLAETPAQQAQALYWRAQAWLKLDDPASARRDYQALVNLPDGAAGQEWLIMAQTAIAPTPTYTPTQTLTPTATRTPTSTATSTATKTLRSTVTPTATKTPRRTPTPTVTRTPAVSPTVPGKATATPQASSTPRFTPTPGQNPGPTPTPTARRP